MRGANAKGGSVNLTFLKKKMHKKTKKIGLGGVPGAPPGSTTGIRWMADIA